MKLIGIPLLLAAALALPAHGADLTQVFAQAQENDSTYAAARAAYVAAQEKVPQGRALILPSVGVSAGINYEYDRTNFLNEPTIVSSNFPNGDRDYNVQNLRLQLVQPLYRKDNYAQYEQGKVQAQQAEYQYLLSRQDLMLRVAQAYFDVLQAQDTLEFTVAQKAAIAEQLAQAKLNFEVGTATITDTHEAQARYDLVVAQEIAAQNDLEIRKRALQQIIGTMPEPLKPLGNQFKPGLPEPNNMDRWVEQAETVSLPIQISQASLEIAARGIDRAQSGHTPTIDLVASYGGNRISRGGLTSSGFVAPGSELQSTVVGVQFALPLYSGGAVDSRVREAVALHERARQDLETARRNAALQARQAFLGVTSGAAQVKALEQALASNQLSLESSILGQEVGVRTAVDVLNARQQLFSAKRDLAVSRYAYILSGLKLKAAAGILGDAELAEVNRLLGD